MLYFSIGYNGKWFVEVKNETLCLMENEVTENKLGVEHVEEAIVTENRGVIISSNQAMTGNQVVTEDQVMTEDRR